MALSSRDLSFDPSLDSPLLDLAQGARLRARVSSGRSSARPGRPSSPPPETASEMAAEQERAVSVDAPSSAPAKGKRSSKSARPMSKLVLDLGAVADAEGLAQEVAVLRASIRQLANNGDMDVHVKVLAELRHQIEALCRALKTQQSLEGPEGNSRVAEMRRVLEELGDDLGVAR